MQDLLARKRQRYGQVAAIPLIEQRHRPNGRTINPTLHQSDAPTLRRSDAPTLRVYPTARSSHGNRISQTIISRGITQRTVAQIYPPGQDA
ncbi:MAG: hypothetical protein ISQ09_02060 [Rubripirellula sp.]|nr:hypothetical protein [Rubripirellula sp.]